MRVVDHDNGFKCLMHNGNIIGYVLSNGIWINGKLHFSTDNINEFMSTGANFGMLTGFCSGIKKVKRRKLYTFNFSDKTIEMYSGEFIDSKWFSNNLDDCKAGKPYILRVQKYEQSDKGFIVLGVWGV